MPALKEIGKRVCIIGPSSSGKSTLARALGKKLDVPVCYLDQLAHVAYTNWVPKDKRLLKNDHQDFLHQHREWVIEGNYSFLMAERFKHATFIIWLDFPVPGSLWRYFKRTLGNAEDRPGNLLGATQQFNWKLIHYMLWEAPKKKDRYQMLITESHVPNLHLTWFRQLNSIYKEWELQKQGSKQ